MSERRFDIDNLKGILIFLVVYTHTLLIVGSKESGLCYDITRVIYFFHMPLFLFLSGLVSKKETSNESFFKYIFLYVLFNSLYGIFSYFVLEVNFTFIYPYFQMWYLLCIITYRLIIKFSTKIILFPISIIVSIVIPFLPIDNTFSLLRMFMFFPFFLLGFFFKDILIQNKRKWKVFGFVFFLVSIVAIYSFSKYFSFKLNFFTGITYETNIDFIFRIYILLVCFILSISSFLLMPNKKIPILSKMGKNSLWIYLLHRFFTIKFPIFIEDKKLAYIAIVVSFVICLIFSLDMLNKIFNFLTKFLSTHQIIVYLTIICVFFGIIYSSIPKEEYLHYYNKKEIDFENCIKISYVGDILFFEQDIKNATNEDAKYDFSKYFENVNKYLGDYTFSVLEGPVSNYPYSFGNYYDNLPFSFNYPISLLDSLSKYIDFVTIANNHLLDRGFSGLQQTINNLERYNISFSGGYLAENEEKVKIVDVKGIKCAVLCYTYGVNEFDHSLSFTHQTFNEDIVSRDIEYAKSKNVDKIIVMNHIGREFSHELTEEEKYENAFFANKGVDIILSSHSHVVKPIYYIDDTLVISCPGNFATLLTSNDQEYSSICNIYINKDTKNIECASITPITSIHEKKSFSYPFSLYELGNIYGSNLVTENMIGEKFSYVLDEYFFDKDGYFTPNVERAVETKNSKLFKYLEENETICFIGDSITEGTANNLYPWYDALNIKAKIHNISKGGATSSSIYNLIVEDETSTNYKNYIIAIGVNDITRGISKEQTINNIERIIDYLGRDKNYIFISPWYYDKVEVMSLMKEYIEALSSFCNEKLYTFVDVTTPLSDFFEENDSYMYLVDKVHPNNREGIKLYSKIFIESLP